MMNWRDPMPAPTNALIDRIDTLFTSSTSSRLRAFIADTVRSLDDAELGVIEATLNEINDLEDRTVRDVLGRDGHMKAKHEYRACRAEDLSESWDHRVARPAVRKLRDALMSWMLGPSGMQIEGAEGVVNAVAAGKRVLFVANHESVFDLPVLARALETAGCPELAKRVTFFVNPKIFNTPFWNFFICKPLGLIKVPQSPRIAANESVMDSVEIRRRATHGFDLASARLAAGDSLAIYPEGLRSQGELHRFARAYLQLLRPESLRHHGLADDDVYIVPWAHQGVRKLEQLKPESSVKVRFGAPVSPGVLFDLVGDQSAGVAAHLIGFLVAQLLPEAQRGLYGTDAATFVDHPHFRLRIHDGTLADVRAAEQLLPSLTTS